MDFSGKGLLFLGEVKSVPGPVEGPGHIFEGPCFFPSEVCRFLDRAVYRLSQVHLIMTTGSAIRVAPL